MHSTNKTFIEGLLILGALGLAASAQTGGSQQGGQGTGQKPAPSNPGQTQPGQPAAGKSTAQTPGPVLQRGDTLIGTDITDATGARIGRIEDLVLRSNGDIAMAVITTADGTKHYPVPWRQLKFQNATSSTTGTSQGADATRRDERVMLGFDKERLKTAPSFDGSQWPQSGDTKIFDEADRFYGGDVRDGGVVSGSTPNPTGQPVDASMRKQGSMLRASQLSNQSITDTQGNPIGTMGQLVYDPAAGRVNFAAIALNNTAAGSPRTVAMPWEAIQTSRQADKDRFQVSMTADRLQSAPQFKAGDDGWKEMSDRKYIDEMYTYYSVRPYWMNDPSKGSNERAGSDQKKPGSDQNKGGSDQKKPDQKKDGTPPK